MTDIYENIYEMLKRKESFCLATILLKKGSAPRGAGTKMIIKKDFSIIGTIGGGLSEALTIKLSKDVFESKNSAIKYFNLSNNDAASLGMVCGGEEKVLIEYIDAEDPDVADIYIKGYEIKRKCESFVFITKVQHEEKIYDAHNKWICTETSFYGKENDEILEVFKKVRENFKKFDIYTVIAGKNKYLIEPVQNCETVYIFGAGHVSQKLAQITKMVDFRTVVLDDRSDFANRQRFKEADDVIVIKSFDNILKDINIDNQSYIIIVTRGHAYDSIVLTQALETDAKYIGMIGSLSKRQFIYSKLLDEGYTEKDLERVHSPIGLNIYAETPEEIAVSIVAEIIKIKHELKQDTLK